MDWSHFEQFDDGYDTSFQYYCDRGKEKNRWGGCVEEKNETLSIEERKELVSKDDNNVVPMVLPSPGNPWRCADHDPSLGR
jgi:hypothetical protein